MNYRIFAQCTESPVDLARLLLNAARAFEPDVRVQAKLDSDELGSAFSAGLRVVAHSARDGWTATFTLKVRRASVMDVADARAADAHGRVYGMSLLAEQCPMVLLFEPAADTAEEVIALVLALLASAVQGPVLSTDAKELFGVRTALERAGVVRTVP
jgi:hypothetical protein